MTLATLFQVHHAKSRHVVPYNANLVIIMQGK